jgi:hypothetical protein
MSSNNNVGARILDAHARHCEHAAAELAAARLAGAPPTELAQLEAQDLAARKRYQELAVDLPGRSSRRTEQPSQGQRPWWRFW